jgi:hypothetical protein
MARTPLADFFNRPLNAILALSPRFHQIALNFCWLASEKAWKGYACINPIQTAQAVPSPYCPH